LEGFDYQVLQSFQVLFEIIVIGLQVDGTTAQQHLNRFKYRHDNLAIGVHFDCLHGILVKLNQIGIEF
jgi:hypothetical protein